MSAYLYCVRQFSSEPCQTGDELIRHEKEIPFTVKIPPTLQQKSRNLELALVELGYTQTWDQLAEENVGFAFKIRDQTFNFGGFVVWEYAPHNALSVAATLNLQISNSFIKSVEALFSDHKEVNFNDLAKAPEIEIERGKCRLLLRGGHILTHPVYINFSPKLARLLGVDVDAYASESGDASSLSPAFRRLLLEAQATGRLNSALGWGLTPEKMAAAAKEINEISEKIKLGDVKIPAIEYITGFPDMFHGSRYLHIACDKVEPSTWLFTSPGVPETLENLSTLRVVKMPKSHFGDYVHISFADRQYRSVKATALTDDGFISGTVVFINDAEEAINFKFGKVVLVLHLRQKNDRRTY